MLEKDYIKATTQLNAIAKLGDNWNNNGTKPFSTKLINKCRKILMQLVREPFISPTACGSIQFEYEKENGNYLEFEIYEDRIEAFIYSLVEGEKEFKLDGVSEIEEMKQMVINFYGSKDWYN